MSIHSPHDLKVKNRTWKPVSLTPVSSEVVSLAVASMRSCFSGEAVSSYRIVPSLMSMMLGFVNVEETFSRTMDCGDRGFLFR